MSDDKAAHTNGRSQADQIQSLDTEIEQIRNKINELLSYGLRGTGSSVQGTIHKLADKRDVLISQREDLMRSL